MSNAWVVRPKPHHKNRVREFLEQDITAIEWPELGNLTGYNTRSEIEELYRKKGDPGSNQSVGQAVGMIHRFLNEMHEGDYIVMPDGSTIYVGRIDNEKYKFREDLVEKGYPHHREVNWLFDKRGIQRNHLTGRVYDSLKARMTLFSTYENDIKEIIEDKGRFFNEGTNVDLRKKYLQKLQTGGLREVHSTSFEECVRILFSNYYPGLSRLATTNSEEGDTDLKTELPGDHVVRIQVKHHYKSKEDLTSNVVEQLASSMEPEDIGIIVTSGQISKETRNYAEKHAKNIGLVDGDDYVDLLFENLEELEDSIENFGLKNELEII